ncbi:zinc finger protein 782 [Trichonephila clavipes]|nr:zinc finger protein 782 [Trichonephila clavipes]
MNSNNIARVIKKEVNSSNDSEIRTLPKEVKKEESSDIKMEENCIDFLYEINVKSSDIGDGRLSGKEQFQNRAVIRQIEKSYVCDVCDKEFKHKSSLKVHYYSHLVRKPHECYVCSLSFTRKYRLVNHSLNHCKKKTTASQQAPEKRSRKSQNPRKCTTTPRNSRLRTCDMCFKEFGTKRELSKHYSVHFNEKPFKCNICDKGFSEKWRLSRHFVFHKGKRFMCKLCCKRFSTKSNLLSHFVSHTDEKPFVCHICNKAFARKDTASPQMQEPFHGGSSHNHGSLWNMTKGFKKRSPISALKGNTGIPYTDEEKAETLADTLENQFQLNNISNPTQDNNHMASF